MRWIAETLAFVALALGMHLLFALRYDSTDGADAGGSGGTALVSIAAASASIETMVERWERPPETVSEVVLRPELPEPVAETPVAPSALPDLAPNLSAPVTLPSAPSDAALPSVDLTPAPPLPEPEPEPEPEPVARPPAPFVDEAPPEPDEQAKLDPEGRPLISRRPPEARPELPAERQRAETPETRPAEAQRQASVASSGQKAAGSGGSEQSGTSGQAAVKTLSKAQRTQLITVWGSQIRARVERQKRFPKGARGKGRVVVRLTVTRDGRIAGASVARSSGNAAFDQAAMAAVSRAGRLPKAPDELTEASYTFNLPVDFQ